MNLKKKTTKFYVHSNNHKSYLKKKNNNNKTIFQTGVANQLCGFTLWSRWYSSLQNNANIKSSETATCHVPYAGHEGT